MIFSTAIYPNGYDIMNIEEGKKWVPKSLLDFMSYLITSGLKQLSLSQCIVQAVRPKTAIIPIPFGVGVSVQKTFASKKI